MSKIINDLKQLDIAYIKNTESFSEVLHYLKKKWENEKGIQCKVTTLANEEAKVFMLVLKELVEDISTYVQISECIATNGDMSYRIISGEKLKRENEVIVKKITEQVLEFARRKNKKYRIYFPDNIQNIFENEMVLKVEKGTHIITNEFSESEISMFNDIYKKIENDNKAKIYEKNEDILESGSVKYAFEYENYGLPFILELKLTKQPEVFLAIKGFEDFPDKITKLLENQTVDWEKVCEDVILNTYSRMSDKNGFIYQLFEMALDGIKRGGPRILIRGKIHKSFFDQVAKKEKTDEISLFLKYGKFIFRNCKSYKINGFFIIEMNFGEEKYYAVNSSFDVKGKTFSRREYLNFWESKVCSGYAL